MDALHRHIVYNVLSSLLLRDLFPDPNRAYFVTCTMQYEFVEWFNSYLIQVLAAMEIFNPDLKRAETKKEAMASIHYRRSNRELAGYTPRRVQEVISFIPGWPISGVGCVPGVLGGLARIALPLPGFDVLVPTVP